MRKLGAVFIVAAILAMASCSGESPDWTSAVEAEAVGQRANVRECGVLVCQTNAWEYTEKGWERCALGLPAGIKASEVKCS